MLRNHLTTACRQLVASKLYTAINLVGLSIGLACFILIGLFVANELSYDDHWRNADRIYRISRDYFASDSSAEAHHAGMPGAAAPLLEEDFPEIEQAARIFCCGAVVKVEDGGTAFMEREYAEADPELFEIFDFEWLRGDPATALRQPTDLVLTASAARRHFGDADPIGQTVLVGGGVEGSWMQLQVAGVIDDLPEQSHLNFSMLGSMLSWEGEGLGYLNNWDYNVFHTYVLLGEGADIADVQARAGDFFERRFEAGSSRYTSFTAMPVEAIHLRSRRQDETGGPGEFKAAGSIAVVGSFAAVATFILLLACINFMNLATARSAKRAKEIGVRKVLGAGRRQLAAQFLVESVLVAALAVAVAVMLVELALPAFNAFLGQNLRFDYLGNPRVLAALAALALATGVVAGSYPALYLSRMAPERVLKNEVAGGREGLLRRALVVGQFAIAIVLLSTTLTVHRQLELVRGIPLGFEKEQLVVIEPNNVSGAQWETLKREWLSHPGIVAVTRADVPHFRDNPRTAEISADGRSARMLFARVDYGFFDVYGIEALAGRAFSPEFGTDAAGGEDGRPTPFVLSELAARRLGWTPDEAVGKWVELGSVQGVRFEMPNAAGPVIGVVRDAQFESARSPLEPMIYLRGGGAAVLRVTGRDLPGTIAHIDDRWKAFRPDLPASRRFLDEDFDAMYRAEERQGQMLAFFAALAVAIACLGLFGLAAYATERRTKEIGIRKVLGGTVPDIVLLFTVGFAKLVVVATLIASPIAYLAMQRWLAGFAYRIELGPLVFVASGLLALAVALGTVGAVAARAASTKPIESLRYE